MIGFRTEAPFVVTTRHKRLKSTHYTQKAAIDAALSTDNYRIIHGIHRGNWLELVHLFKGERFMAIDTDTNMYAYVIQEGELNRCRVVSYNPTTERFTAIGAADSRHFIGSFDSDSYFKTPEEAIKAEHDGYLEGVHTARQEVSDALAAYKVIRKMARMSLEEFSAIVPKAY